VRLASVRERIHGAGAEVIAVSVDDDVRQAGMFARWPTPDVLYVSDPGGTAVLRPLGLFDPDERGGIALPALLVIDPEGVEVFRYQGRDFADRTHDDDVVAAVEALGLEPIEAPVGGPVAEVPDDLDRYFSPDHFGPYFRGNRFGAVAIGGRTADRELRGIAREHRLMAEAMLEAWTAVRGR
jgi:hypothetical protein